MKKDFDAKFDILLTMLTKCQEKLGIDAVSYSASPVNEVVDHTPNVVGDDHMVMDDVPCSDNEKIVEDANVPDVDMIENDVITPGFIPDGDLLEVEVY
ncbi:hypothetical protein TorRG33x02_022780 [Trema orientale]|uniref:Uncharacterized protein n=1 Tax=Trema orientale TaxID=63057 RepID=A0A2P5FW14_TREOI|nr:hypothetical protein TorRG33x02_022780 [Trema orientale]